MKSYEIMTIYDADRSDEEAKELSEEVAKLIDSLGGEVTDRNFWGKRKFAYPLNHKEEGYYDVINFRMEKSKLSEFKTKLNLIEDFVRYLITASDL